VFLRTSGPSRAGKPTGGKCGCGDHWREWSPPLLLVPPLTPCPRNGAQRPAAASRPRSALDDRHAYAGFVLCLVKSVKHCRKSLAGHGARPNGLSRRSPPRNEGGPRMVLANSSPLDRTDPGSDAPYCGTSTLLCPGCPRGGRIERTVGLTVSPHMVGPAVPQVVFFLHHALRPKQDTAGPRRPVTSRSAEPCPPRVAGLLRTDSTGEPRFARPQGWPCGPNTPRRPPAARWPSITGSPLQQKPSQHARL